MFALLPLTQRLDYLKLDRVRIFYLNIVRRDEFILSLFFLFSLPFLIRLQEGNGRRLHETFALAKVIC